MTARLSKGVASATPTFDPTVWLAGFTTLGGVYALGADRRLALIAAGPCRPDLTAMVAQIEGRPDHHEALCTAIELRQAKEVWA